MKKLEYIYYALIAATYFMATLRFQSWANDALVKGGTAFTIFLCVACALMSFIFFLQEKKRINLVPMTLFLTGSVVYYYLYQLM